MNPTRQHRPLFRLWPFRRAATQHPTPTTVRPVVNATVPPLLPLPTPVLRWVSGGRIAVRAFEFLADADAVCAFQAETYEFNFPDFRYTSDFGQAFRFDLRRASLDAQHGLFVLDDRWAIADESPSEMSEQMDAEASVIGEISRSRPRGVCGFLWLVLCQNTWTGERYGYVNNLYLAPHRRGQGLGRELLAQADAFFRSRGIHRVRLTVSAHNEAAVHLYRNNGYGVTRWEMEKEI